MNNVIKHSRASQINIVIDIQDESLKIIISDNGIGYNETFSKKGNGIKNMIKRIEEIKGTLKLSNMNGKGTHIEMVVPIKNIA